MPYPWFERQKKLFSNVTFPDVFQGVSTHKSDVANGRLIEEFVRANLPRFPSGIFMDLQAVDESHIGPCGAWRSLMLVPHGAVYRVLALNPKRSDVLSMCLAALPQSQKALTSMASPPLTSWLDYVSCLCC